MVRPMKKVNKGHNKATKGKKLSRRDLIKLGSTGIAAIAVTSVAKRVLAAEQVVKHRRWGMVIDLRRCYGCHTCSIACKAEFDVPLGVWRSWVKILHKGEFPNTQIHFLPRLCNHCEHPSCVHVCPVKATYKSKNGAVLQRYDRCIGCRYCMQACPYNARYRLPRKTGAVPYERIIDKCDFCVHRVNKGLEPACVNACPARARIFGDLNDPNSEARKLISKNPTSTLKPEMGTKPRVYYIGLEEAIIGGRVTGYNPTAPEVPEGASSTNRI
jgi:Fe-S-cluster-containing dehydrogenase component